ncbi:nuclear transport factor 2 family protein [Nocardioides dubius]|uniref:DUF4440 domain-containing protein n=1 Tax=Nocardioides dubius TaxID=317019 RepID=A0ABN1TY85_9ACTN
MPETYSDVAALEALRWDGLLAADTDALATLFHDDLAYTHSNGLVDSKGVFLQRLASGGLRYLDISPSDQRITLHDNTAVVTGLVVLTTRAGDSQAVTPIRYTAVWTRGERWQHVAWHSSPASA